jgi:hypothetical protein
MLLWKSRSHAFSIPIPIYRGIGVGVGIAIAIDFLFLNTVQSELLGSRLRLDMRVQLPYDVPYYE